MKELSKEKTIDELAAEERKAYFKKWRSENKDKVKKHNQNYWIKRAMKQKNDSKEV